MVNKHQTVQSLLDIANAMTCASDSPQLDSQLLLANRIGQSREWLLAHSDEVICTTLSDEFLDLMKRRQKGEPVAYLLGHRDFWKSKLKVTSDTLIPRPETELIVETILTNLDNKKRLVVDLGTGSGAIAVALAIERPEWTVIGVDISLPALRVARTNGADLENLHWFQGDWCNALRSHQVDLLVCNPPYIAEDDTHLDALSYEPQGALVSSNHGMQDLEEVIVSAQSILKANGHLLVEHGHEQQIRVCDQLRALKFDPTPLTDFAGNPRAVWARRVQDT